MSRTSNMRARHTLGRDGMVLVELSDDNGRTWSAVAVLTAAQAADVRETSSIPVETVDSFRRMGTEDGR